eukprot:TRINITY_DN1084_c0_g1_i3.p1 TRINITY_DN1084_c0_g1~~TRINITY_DN1084_c0_g1_i3.p1  ORF type:complete len:379 (-),score=62.35 TRINITY_DN1084_c0_g1_i3:118-1254(-)
MGCCASKKEKLDEEMPIDELHSHRVHEFKKTLNHDEIGVTESDVSVDDLDSFRTDAMAHALGQVDESPTSDEEDLEEDEPTDSGSEDDSRSLSPYNQARAKSHPLPSKKQTHSDNPKFPKFKKPLSAIPHHLRMEGFARQKHNSTSSLYINTTLSKPDTDEVLHCMAQAVLYHIEKGIASPHKTFFEIFDENKFPITKEPVDTKTMPNSDSIYHFISTIFRAERLDPECAIMCLAYIERIIVLTGITIDPSNWRRVVLSALILASKVWEDQSVWNVDFLPVFDNLTSADLNKLERQFLALLQYNVSLNASLYAKYYFELRTFSQVDPQNFPLQPLDKLNAKRLEDHSQASEHRVRTFKRSASVDQLHPVEPHTPVVLN